MLALRLEVLAKQTIYKKSNTSLLLLRPRHICTSPTKTHSTIVVPASQGEGRTTHRARFGWKICAAQSFEDSSSFDFIVRTPPQMEGDLFIWLLSFFALIALLGLVVYQVSSSSSSSSYTSARVSRSAFL